MRDLVWKVDHEGSVDWAMGSLIGDVEYAAVGWVDWYHNRRLPSTLGMTAPVELEQAHNATLHREPQPL